TRRCDYCGRSGHVEADCFKKARDKVALSVHIGDTTVQHKFYVASASLIYPVILGRDILTACKLTISFNAKPKLSTAYPIVATASARGAERDAWKLLPKGWLLDEVVLDNNDIYIVAARPENETADESKHRFYVGINPSLV
ncbi:hypothetical protein FOZ63_015436, partial [Perkinsus olseni]